MGATQVLRYIKFNIVVENGRRYTSSWFADNDYHYQVIMIITIT